MEKTCSKNKKLIIVQVTIHGAVHLAARHPNN